MNAAAMTLLVYMATLVAIGIWASRKAASQDDFLLGGRDLGPIVAGLAYAASTSSAWVLLGFTGFVANSGVSALWMVPGILAGYAFVWLWMGPWLNRASRDHGFLTALDVLAAWTGPWRFAIKAVSAAMLVFCFLFYIAAQFQGAGNVLGDVFRIDPRLAVIIGAVVILAYTFLGGFWAVSLTDTLQGFAIALIAIILPAAAFFAVGGWAGLSTGMAGQDQVLNAPFGSASGWMSLGFVLGLSAIGFGAAGQPHLLTWVMAVRDRKARIQGAMIAIGWGALVYGGMSILALSMRAMAEPGSIIGESLVFETAQQLLPGILPALVYAAILSAIMSTVDSQLLVASAAASHDLNLVRFSPKGAKGEVWVTRILIVAICAGAVLLTLYLPASIFGRVLFAWTALGAAFGPTIVARIAGRQPHGAAVLMAIIVGFALAVTFNQFIDAGVGAWRERILPWVIGLMIVFMFSKPASQETKP